MEMVIVRKVYIHIKDVIEIEEVHLLKCSKYNPLKLLTSIKY